MSFRDTIRRAKGGQLEPQIYAVPCFKSQATDYERYGCPECGADSGGYAGPCSTCQPVRHQDDACECEDEFEPLHVHVKPRLVKTATFVDKSRLEAAEAREVNLLGALAEIARADTLDEARAIAEAHLEEKR